MTKTIITHSNPDFDAVAYVWLMKRHVPGFEDAQIKFMPFNALDRNALDAANSVGDMGGEYDPGDLRFDHHQFEGERSTATCAAMQLWHMLLAKGYDLEYLKPLIVEIYNGDLAQTPAVGIHSLMRGWKLAAREIDLKLSDYEIYSYGRGILDGIATDLKKRAANKIELDQVVIWKSDDNLIWAIQDGGAGTGFAAYGEGARVVVFQGEPIKLSDGTITYPVGASRAPEWQEPHLGTMVKRLIVEISNDADLEVKNELNRWFRHNAGFYVGRGGAKAPDSRPLKVNLIEIVQAIDAAWER